MNHETTNDNSSSLLADQLSPDIPDPPTISLPAPLLIPAVAMAAGITADYWIEPPYWSYLAIWATAAVLFAWPMTRTRPIWSLMAASFALGSLLHDYQYRRVPPEHIVRFASDEPTLVRVTGVVVTQPQFAPRRQWFFSKWSHGSDKTRFTLDARTIDGRSGPICVSGLVSVRLDGPLTGIHAGDLVRITGHVRRSAPPSNPGQFDFDLWRRRNGIRVDLRCDSAALLSVVSPTAVTWRRALQTFRAWARSMLIDESALNDDSADDLMETVVLGKRRAVDQNIERMFLRTGTTHYLSVSGAHIGVVAWFVWSLGRRLGGSRRRCALGAAAAIALYALLVDPEPPVLRAAVIGLAFCVAAVLRRTTSMANSISLAAVLLLCIRPTALFEPGFQMSFAGVYAICYLSDPLIYAWKKLIFRFYVASEPAPGPPPHRSLMQSLLNGAYRSGGELVAVGLAACLATTPIMAMHFDRIAPLGFIYSIIIAPFFSVMVFAGFVAVVLGGVSPITLAVTQPIAHGTSRLVLGVVELLDAVSPEYRGVWAVLFLVIYCGMIALLIVSVPVDGATIWTRVAQRGRWVGAAIVPMGVFSVYLSASTRSESLRVTHLAVGRGTACVIEFPDGAAWVYDCGTNWDFDVGESIVAPYCRTRDIRRIDRVIISHPNLDHFNGVIGLADQMPIGEIVVNSWFYDFSNPGGPPDALLDELARRNIAIHDSALPDQPIELAGVTVEFVWPTADATIPRDANDTSTVIRFTHAGTSILMCGDIERQAMAALLSRSDLAADVLVLPHHGSVETNTSDFIAAVNPSLCIRSTNQSMREAAKPLLDAIADRPVLNTAEVGAVTVEIDQDSTGRAWAFRDPNPHPIKRRGE